ncbi:hypothetical protein TTHERM_00442440 (macronuclear) [Tetrahymena thermophila SB210]|uniref:Uncharacterized protein n=1 Tax=Tetrahymena thermophila (strain SB210) TaxID=312017 RepID=I7MGV2_TETTS|nr:hypothetical protein TTHERM_00442440 [Tetrahymena thermophila SB210]EAR85494.2 hypothetical protein TTHERM_00442440 [Tetrahymena thermophila SB210]|eukprot:XP_001033157.2 hypothetical protein TTHERM_00442440 [Tetrahymena thermophila SB210]
MNIEKESNEPTKQSKISQSLAKGFETQLQVNQKQQSQSSNSNQGSQNGFVVNGSQTNSSSNGSGSFVLHNNQSNANKSEILKNSKINSQKINNKSIQQSQQNNCQVNANNLISSNYNTIQNASEQDEIKEEMRKKIKYETYSNHSGSNSGDNYTSQKGVNLQQGVMNNFVSYNSSQNNEQIFNENPSNGKQIQQQQQIQQANNVNQQPQTLLDDQQFRNIQSTLMQLQEQNNIQNQKIQQQHTYQQQIQQMIPELVMLMQNQSLGQNQMPFQNQIQPIQQQNQNQQQIQKNNILHAFLNSMMQQQQQPSNNIQPQIQNQTQHSQIGIGNIVGQNVFNQNSLQQPQQNNNQVSQILSFLQNNGNNANNNGNSISNIQEEENQKNMHLIQQIQDFYSKIVSFEEVQSNMIKELYKKSNHQFELISNVRQEIMQIRESIRLNNQSKQQGQQSNQQNNFDFSQLERANLPQETTIGSQGASSLLQYLFNKQDSDFKYELKPAEEIPHPFYRERNFSIKLQLYDRQGNMIQNQNKVTLTMALYTSENPPQVIKQNTLGNQILKGFLEKELYLGRVSFDKIQIKEVTSHYLNGWIYLIIFPKHPKESKLQSNQGNQDHVEIKPLILEKIIVKAKKMRENKFQNSNKNQQLIQKSEEDKSSMQSDNKLSQQQINSNACSGMRDEDEENDEEDDEIDNDIDNEQDEDMDEDSTNNQNIDSSQQKKDDPSANQQQILNLKIEQEKSQNTQQQLIINQEVKNK